MTALARPRFRDLIYHRAATSDQNDVRREYGPEAETLARVGAAIFPQPTMVSVRLPARLADLALAAWRRDDDASPAVPETTEQRATRQRAGTLALIGLCIEQTGRPDRGEVVCEIDAWYIGQALDAADERQLLAGLRPPSCSST
jgi:hypothetical protein